MNMEVMAVLATASTGPEELVDRVARIVCREIADSCAIAILSEDGRELHPLGLFDCRTEIMAELDIQAELAWGSSGGFSQPVLDTGEPLLVTEADPDQLARGRPRARALLKRLALDSAIMVPMRSAGTTLGVVAVSRTASRQPFATADIPFLQMLADKVALGLANARLRERLDERTPAEAPSTHDTSTR